MAYMILIVIMFHGVKYPFNYTLSINRSPESSQTHNHLAI